MPDSSVSLEEFVSLIAEMKTEEEYGKDCPPSEDWICAMNELITSARALVPVKVIVDSPDGIRVDVYRTHAHRFEMDYTNGQGGEWQYRNTFPIPGHGVCDGSLFEGMNECDAGELRTAIAQAQSGMDQAHSFLRKE